MMWWILLGLQAQAAPDLPKLEAFDASLTQLEELLDTAEASGNSLAEVQATFTNQRCVRGKCPQDLVVALQDAARTFGQRYRLDVQATRAQAGRVERLSDVPTISPMLDAERRRRLRLVRERVEQDSQRFLKRSAWNRRFVIGQRWTRPGVVEEVEEQVDPLLMPLPQGMAGGNIAAIRSTMLPAAQRPGPDMTGVAEGRVLSAELASALGEWGLLWVEAIEGELPEVEEEPVQGGHPQDPTFDPGFGEPGYVPRSQRKPVQTVDPGVQGVDPQVPSGVPGDQPAWELERDGQQPVDPATAPGQREFDAPDLAPGSAVPSRPAPIVPEEDIRPTPDPVPRDPVTPAEAPEPAPTEPPPAQAPSEPPPDLDEPSQRTRRERRRERREASGGGGQ